MGAIVEEVSLPMLPEAAAVSSVVVSANAAFVHRHWLRTRPLEYGPGLRRQLLAGAMLPAQVLVQADRARAVLRREWASLFRSTTY